MAHGSASPSPSSPTRGVHWQTLVSELVLLPGNDGHAGARATVNLFASQSPALMVGALNPTGVQATVRVRWRTRASVAALATGHGRPPMNSGDRAATQCVRALLDAPRNAIRPRTHQF